MRETPEKEIRTLYQKIRPEWKLSFAATFITGLAAYLYKFMNNLPNWDTFMDYYYPTNNMLHQGRQFQIIACAPGSFVDTPWITGLLCLCYIAVSAILIQELFGIRSRSGIVLSSGLLVTFPTMISSFAYMYMADAFSVALLCSVAAVYITQRRKKGFLAGALVLGFGIGVYQGFLSFAIALILLWTMKELLFGVRDGKQESRLLSGSLLRFLGMGILALIFYYVSLQICVRLEGIPLSGHQGMGTMHLPDLMQILTGVKRAYIDTLYFYLGSLQSVSLYQVLNVCLLLCCFTGTIAAFIRMKASGKTGRIFLFLLCVFVYPCVCYIYYFVSEDVFYHTLMIMPLCLVYLWLILLQEHGKHSQTVTSSWLRLIPLVLCGLLVYNNAVTANISYRILNTGYEKTLNTMTRIVDRMEQLEGFEGVSRLAVYGELPDSDTSSITLGTEIVGITGGQIISHQLHIVAMLDEYYHIQLTGCTEEERASLESSEVYRNMAIWPQEGSVAVCNDTLLIRFE